MAATWSSELPTTHQEVWRYNQLKYTRGVGNGEFMPVTYPMFSYGAAVLISYFLVPQVHSRVGRTVTFALSSAWHLFLILNCKAYSPQGGFGIGIICGWGILWSATVLIFNDAVRDWRRVKREAVEKVSLVPAEKLPSGAGVAPERSIVRRRRQDEVASPGETMQSSHAEPAGGRAITHRWQSYPDSCFHDRLEWTLDLLSNFRGVGWNWTIPGLPSRPPFVEASLKQDALSPKDVQRSRTGIVRYDNYWSLIMHNLRLVVVGYLILDVIKTIMNHDPYFWGLVDLPPPDYFPFSLVRESFLLIRVYRLVVGLGAMWIGLRTIFALGPLVFVGVLGERWLGANGEPWMYPDQFGSFAVVSERGLAGWWSGWWHQIFRGAFQHGGRWLSDDVLGMTDTSFARTATQTCTAFALSALLHAAGSITMIGDTRPLNPMVFFLLQPVALFAEMGWKALLERIGLRDRIPAFAARAANLLFVHAWFLSTAPMLVDDFARGGILHFEPVVLSPLRGLGFGTKEDGFFCWQERLAWHQDARWWLTGIAL